MCRHLVLHLNSVLINKILATESISVKSSQNLNLMQNISAQWNQQLSGYVFSKVIEYLEQNIRKQIDCKRQSSTKQMKREHIDIQIEELKYANRIKTR